MLGSLCDTNPDNSINDCYEQGKHGRDVHRLTHTSLVIGAVWETTYGLCNAETLRRIIYNLSIIRIESRLLLQFLGICSELTT